MIDEFIALLRGLARDKLTQREMEELRQKLFILMSQGREAVDSLNGAGVITGLNADLLDGQHGAYYRDAEKLNGQPGSYYLNATNLNAGTLHPDRFSAYADLVAEDRLGMSAGQVAPGDHTHAGLGGNTNDIYLTLDGFLAPATSVFSLVIPRDSEVEAVYLHCRNTGTSGTTIIDVNRNGSTMFTTQSNRPALAYNDPDGVASGVTDIVELLAGDLLTVDIDAAAAGSEGLNVVVRLRNAVDATARRAQLYFASFGILETGYIPARYYNRAGRTRTMMSVWLNCETPPQGQSLIVDILLNGASIFAQPEHRPSINPGAYGGYATQIASPNWQHGDYLMCNIVQVGSPYPGSDLVITIVYY